jgi:acetyltransferase
MIEPLTVLNSRDRDDLVALLIDSVADGSSIGYLRTPDEAEARHYWQGVEAELGTGSRILLVARAGDRIVGTVQLAMSWKPSAAHRAEVQKLLVHTSARRQGLGNALMAAIEETARGLGRSLLFLDTRAGDASNRLYVKRGYLVAGMIPGYALGPTGIGEDSVFYYKPLTT